MREPWTEVPRGIDRVACRAAERDADAQDEDAHEQGLQPAAENEIEDTLRLASASTPSATLPAMARMPNTSTAVPMISVTTFAPGLLIAGAVQKTPSLASLSVVTAQCGKYASHTRTAPMNGADCLRGKVAGHLSPGEPA